MEGQAKGIGRKGPVSQGQGGGGVLLLHVILPSGGGGFVFSSACPPSVKEEEEEPLSKTLKSTSDPAVGSPSSWFGL